MNNYQLLYFFLFFLLFFYLYNRYSDVINETYQNQLNQSILPPIYVINLCQTSNGQLRWNAMQNTLFSKTGKMQRYCGIYGKAYSFDNEILDGILTNSWDYGKWKGKESHWISITPSEMGCILSHYKLWQKILNQTENEFLILEDDSTLVHPDFLNKYKQIYKSLPMDWDILLLNFWLHKNSDEIIINSNITKVKDFVLLNAYVINKRAIQKINQLLPINMPIDSWLSSQSSNLNIYRHNYYLNKKHKKRRGNLIRQNKITPSTIQHTNNW